MKLLFKQRVFSWLDKFDIFDEDGEVVFHIEGKMVLGRKLEILDKNHIEIATIEKVMLSFLPTYKMFIDGREVGTIKKELSFLRPKFVVNYNGWEVEGDFWDWSYSILSGNTKVATIAKEFLRMSDVYSIDVLNEENLLQVVMVVLAIDAIKDDKSSNSN